MGGVAVALVLAGAGDRGEPGFAADGPEFVGGGELVRGVEGAEGDADLVAAGAEEDGAAGCAGVAAPVAAGFAGDGDGLGREDGGGVEEGAVMLAAVHAVAEADAVGGAGGGDADGAAEAGGGVGHGGNALRLRGGECYSRSRRASKVAAGRVLLRFRGIVDFRSNGTSR